MDFVKYDLINILFITISETMLKLNDTNYYLIKFIQEDIFHVYLMNQKYELRDNITSTLNQEIVISRTDGQTIKQFR